MKLHCLLMLMIAFCSSKVVSNEIGKKHIPNGMSMNIHSIQMVRDNNGGTREASGDQNAGSTALTFSYETPVIARLSGKFEYVGSWKQFSGGSYDDPTPDYSLALNDFQVINVLYANYAFGNTSLNNKYLRIGRQVLNLNFVTANKLRHKNQSFQGAVFRWGEDGKYDLVTGHIDKYSTWSSNYSTLNGEKKETDFVDVELKEGVADSHHGIQFLEARYGDIDGLNFSVYDHYWRNLYNTLGLNIDYTKKRGAWWVSWTGKYISQSDIGSSLSGKVDSQGFQINALFKNDRFSIEPGVFKVDGSTEENTIRSPFAVNLAVEKALYETDLTRKGGSVMYYLDASYVLHKHSFNFMYFNTVVEVEELMDSVEYDLIYGYQFSDQFSAKIKYAYVDQKGNGNTFRVSDYRLFLNWQL